MLFKQFGEFLFLQEVILEEERLSTAHSDSEYSPSNAFFFSFFPYSLMQGILQPLCKSCSDKHKYDTRSHCVGPGSGSVDKALECLQGKHDSISSGLQQHKHLILVAHTYNPKIQEAKTGWSGPKTYG